MKRGQVILLTGLSGSGKSTLAGLLQQAYEAHGHRVTVLDGDVLRQHLSPELGFSRADRVLNLQRAAFVAAEVARHGGVCICALIAPYAGARGKMRQMVQEAGGDFFEVYLSTPLSVCEQRDPKALYRRARMGELSQFTGVSDPYEVPAAADLILNTEKMSPSMSAQQIAQFLNISSF
jgi:sulfate adenylyltransferase